MSKITKQYLALRNEIDQLTDKLSKEHFKHMKCKLGCDMCCMDYSILAIEFNFIKDEIKKLKEPLHLETPKSEKECIFLKDHKCSIYNIRPIICRTHGLPLLFMNDDENWELSACELNFTSFKMDEFTEENTYPQDKFNSKLFVLNQKFIDEQETKEYDKFDLVPIRKLKEYI